MDIFDFEELTAEMLGVTDEKREDDNYLPDLFVDKYGMDFEDGFAFARDLLEHTIPVKAGLSEKNYHAFVSKTAPVMLMKLEAKTK